MNSIEELEALTPSGQTIQDLKRIAERAMTCAICGHRAKLQLDQHVLFRHWMTVSEYRKKFKKRTR